MSGPLLRVRDLSTSVGTHDGVLRPVDGVSFDLEPGEILGLIGESGSGKSMTGYSLLGLVEPPVHIAAGSIQLDGGELVGLPRRELRKLRGRRMAMIFQDPLTTLNPVLSVFAQMRLAIAAHEWVSAREARRRCVDVLNRVGIPDAARRLDDYPHQFSGGMRQRVAIAMALLHRPALIVADEPTTALDVSVQAQIMAEVKELVNALGTALIWISHDLATVSSLASRVLVMYAGRIVEEGPTAQVLRAPRHPYTRGLLASLPMFARPGEELAQIPGAPPSLAHLPQGCAFAPRCPRADRACLAAPAPTSTGARSWRCHHPLEAGTALAGERHPPSAGAEA
jgi:peptide/nickel transport system ATP-binding protein